VEAQQRGYPMKERSASAEVAEDFSTGYPPPSGCIFWHVLLRTGGLAMAKGYWVVNVGVTDMNAYKAYMAANAVPFRTD